MLNASKINVFVKKASCLKARPVLMLMNAMQIHAVHIRYVQIISEVFIVNAKTATLVLHPWWPAKHPVKMLNAAIMHIVSPMVKKRTAFAKMDGHLIQMISQLVV